MSIEQKVEQYFQEYPQSPQILKVGNEIFLAHATDAANHCAAQTEQKVEIVKNPALGAGEAQNKQKNGIK